MQMGSRPDAQLVGPVSMHREPARHDAGNEEQAQHHVAIEDIQGGGQHACGEEHVTVTEPARKV